MVEQQYILLRGREIKGIEKLDTYVKNGGYDGLKKALSMTPEAVIVEVKASGLRR
jgi:NADH:ubiquinone oxidoreductase subunit F (NADH-binding)